jgi:hypothetical protein
MMRTAPFCVGLLILGSLHGQAMVEYGLASSAAGMNAAPMGDMGKALRDLLSGKTNAALGNVGANRQGINLPPGTDIGKMVNGSPDIAKILGAGFNGNGGFNMDPMQRILQSMQPQGPADPTVTRVPPEKMATPKADGRTYEDPRLIQPGMAYDDLVERFGPPAMEMTTGPGGKSLMYVGMYGTTMIEVQDGRVATPEAPKPKANPAAATPRNLVVMTVR